MKKILLTLLLSAGVLSSLSAATLKQISLTSPDKANTVIVSYDGVKLSYTLMRGKHQVLRSTPISMTVNGKIWGSGDRLRRAVSNSVDEETTFAVQRKYASTRNAYNEVILPFGAYSIEFRAYNDGVAYRFVGTTNLEAEINAESAGYRFDKDYMSYTLLTKELHNWFEEDYTYKPLSELPSELMSITPVMVRADECTLMFAEADLYNYSGSYMRPTGDGFDLVWANYPKKEEFFDGTNKIYATERYDYIVRCNTKRTFPWRVVGIFPADDDTAILTSELIYLLSTPTADDYSWIRPGKVLWDWWNHNNIYNVDFKAGINTATYLYMVDYAAAHGFEYILIDEGWSGRDDLLTLNPETDIPTVCRYAETKGVGVCLWAKWINVDKQLDEAFDMMASWGVTGVKIDFMDRNDAKMVNFFERVARKATECHFLIDFHGSYPNEGMRAKYPNLMTREGVLGLEYNKWSERATPQHQLIIPYLRQWVGPMDFTPGSMLNAQPDCFRVNNIESMSQGTRCHQMAMYIVYESPLQMLSDSPTKYDENPLWLPFLETVPTVWDETIPLFGRVGEDIAVARRSGERYFVGAMTASAEADDCELLLSFLPEGKYTLTLYTDGVNADVNARDFKLTTITVDNKTIVPVHFARNGGMVAVIEQK